MSYALKPFTAPSLTVSYDSDVTIFETRGNRTGIFQTNCNTGDTVVLQARISADYNWINVITVSDADAQQEVIMAPEFRVVVTNTSGLEVLAAIHV
jgi:hypothetical protein